MVTEIHPAIELCLASKKAVARIVEVLDHAQSIPKDTGIKDIDGKGGEKGWSVRFSHVQFAYPALIARPVLMDVSFEIQPGRLLGILGSPGGGKSAVCSLISRFYEVGDAMVYIQDRDIRILDRASLRQGIGACGDGQEIFTASFRDNIALGLVGLPGQEAPISTSGSGPLTDLEMIEEVCLTVGLAPFIRTLSHGYNTMIGPGTPVVISAANEQVSHFEWESMYVRRVSCGYPWCTCAISSFLLSSISESFWQELC